MTTAALRTDAPPRTRATASNKTVLRPSVRDLAHRLAQRSDDDFAKRSENAVTSRQWCLLAALSGHEGCSQTALVELTGIDRSTLADVVRRMQRHGLLQRRRTKEDARTYAVRLTDEGRRVLRTLSAASTESDRGILCVLSHTEQRTFMGLLERVAKG